MPAGEAAPAAERFAFAHLPKVVHLGLKVAQQAGGVGRAGLARVRLDERAQLLPRRAGGQPLHGDDVEVDLGRQVACFFAFLGLFPSCFLEWRQGCGAG